MLIAVLTAAAAPPITTTDTYAYPREIEFVDDLPKTLAGKIRRIELRQREQERAGQS